ncbi:hypothetical protein B296_00017095 [Ensete ventricosum]|uniref:Uncharacterized protein n=1 Tax=Ensete ventricosum TaxID=4639 RepID=A0A426ZYK4_ENSVE|nr:hypothetical protein B296_00017095 [Ensete ventricosum]
MQRPPYGWWPVGQIAIRGGTMHKRSGARPRVVVTKLQGAVAQARTIANRGDRQQGQSPTTAPLASQPVVRGKRQSLTGRGCRLWRMALLPAQGRQRRS